MRLCVFEDEKYSGLNPLAYTRPVYDLLSGTKTLLHAITGLFPKARLTLLCRGLLASVVRERHEGVEVNSLGDETCLFINGRAVFSSEAARHGT